MNLLFHAAVEAGSKMHDPTPAVTNVSSLSLAAFLSWWLGGDYGPYVALLLTAMTGAIWGVSAYPTTTRLHGALLFFRYTITAVVLVGGGTALAAGYLDTPFESPVDLSNLVAFTVAAVGDRWKDILSRLNPRGLVKPRGTDQ